MKVVETKHTEKNWNWNNLFGKAIETKVKQEGTHLETNNGEIKLFGKLEQNIGMHRENHKENH